jgi:hypothetical protein
MGNDTVPEFATCLYEKYKSLGPFVQRFEPPTITMMYKEYKGPMTFYPTLGLFFNEFALMYTATMNNTKVSPKSDPATQVDTSPSQGPHKRKVMSTK